MKKYIEKYTVENFFEGDNVCKKCGKDLSKAVSIVGRSILTTHVRAHAQEDSHNAILSCREQIQEDLRCLLDGQDEGLIDQACQIVVDRFKVLE